MSAKRPTADDHARQIRRIRALELRIEGKKTIRQIASELGISNAQVSKDIYRAIKDEAEDCPDLIRTHREVEGHRIDEWQAQVLRALDRATDIDDINKCIDRLVKLSERRSKLFGLDAPIKQEIETTIAGHVTPAHARELMKQYFSTDVTPDLPPTAGSDEPN